MATEPFTDAPGFAWRLDPTARGPAGWRGLAGAALLALACAAAARSGLDVEMPTWRAVLVWLPAGIALGSMLRWGLGLWPGALIGVLVATWASGFSPLAAVLIAVGTALEGLVGAWLIRAVAGAEVRLGRLREAVLLIALGAVVAPIVGAAFATAGLRVDRMMPDAGAGTAGRLVLFGATWLAHALGTVLAAPIVLVWTVASSWRLRRRSSEAVVAFALLLLTAAVVWVAWARAPAVARPLLLAPFPVLVWIGLRLGVAGASVANLVVGGSVVAAAVAGSGPFASVSPATTLALAWVFLAFACITTLVLAVVAEDRAEAIRRLAESERRFAEAQRVAHLGSWEWDVASDALRWSEEMFRIHRRPRSLGPMDETWLQSVHPDDRERVDRRLENLMRGRAEYSLDHRILTHNGDVRSVHAEAVVVHDEWGRPLRVVGTALDTTDHVAADGHRREVEEQQRRIDKVESLEALAAGVAHDFNNLLMGILGNTELARLKLPPGHPSASHLERIEDATSRAREVAERMLAFSAHGAIAREPSDLGELVRSAVAEAAQGLPPEVRLDMVVPVGLVPIRVNPVQLRSLVANLVDNAVEAISPGEGTVSVTLSVTRCERDELSCSYVDDHLESGSYLCLEVHDTGCGIDADVLAKVCDPFLSTRGLGRGLGMAVVLGVVRGHRGALAISSAPGVGTTVRVLLPTFEPAAPTPIQNPEPCA